MYPPKAALLTALLIALHTTSAIAAEHTKDSLATVKKNIEQKKALLVDVREKSEWDQGHLKGAKLLPLSRLRAGVKPKTLAKQLSKKKIVYCHCRSGGRVLPAADILKKLGYDVRPLKQGYAKLFREGFAKAKTPGTLTKP